MVQRKSVEFTSSEPAEAPVIGADRDRRTGRPLARTMPITHDQANRLKPYSDHFHDLHSGPRAGSKINPLYDLRKDPMTRFSEFLDSTWNTYDTDEEALNYAVSVFQEQGDNIAGDWRYVAKPES